MKIFVILLRGVTPTGKNKVPLYATKHSDSKFNNSFFERKLKVSVTTRNSNTMARLAALAAASQSTPAGAKRRS